MNRSQAHIIWGIPFASGGPRVSLWLSLCTVAACLFVDGVYAQNTGRDPQRIRLAEIAPTRPVPSESRDACIKSLALRKKRHLDGPTKTRIGTWNIRWFPDGVPGKTRRIDRQGTDLEWTACLLAHLDAEAVALQELKTLPRAKASMATVLQYLDRHTGGRWKVEYDVCPIGADLHVGVIWDSTRVQKVGPARTIGAFNPHGVACKHHLRPGLLVPLRLSDGATVNLISVHFKSGVKRRSYDLRAKTYAALEKVTQALSDEVIIAGDFNTMGCTKCSPKITGQAERAALGELSKSIGLRDTLPAPACSYVYRGNPSLLDGFLTRGVSPRAETWRAMPLGHCAVHQCRGGLFAGAAVVRQVSDHCPLVIER